MKIETGVSSTIVTTAATLCVLLYIWTGPLLAAVMLAASAIAFVAFLRRPLPADAGPQVVAPYILAISVTLLLAAARLWSGFPVQMADHWTMLFVPSYASADVTWFLATATLPVTLMLFGGFALLRGFLLGRYLAWWTFTYAMLDGLLQGAVEFGTPGYEHRFLVGALLAAIQIALGAYGWLKLASQSGNRREPRFTPLDSRQKVMWSAAFVVFVTLYGVTLYSQAGFMPVVIIVGSMIGGLIAWLRTSAVTPVDRMKVVPIYLLMLALFYFHVGEEGLTAFAHGIAIISGNPWTESDFIYVIGLLGPAIWVAAALGMWLRQPWGDFLVWFMIVGMILGEPAHHVIFPVVAAVKLGIGYTYFSGMVTALFPMIPAIILLRGIVADARAARAAGERPVAASYGLASAH